ncbi:MAG: hypothetical protein DDG60_01675 [Anaerolineae bacterium]|nr:MAG: hypothetical protein DDG60_01675 [Anaerolineae bacterium]
MKLSLQLTERHIPWLFALLTILAYGLLLFHTGFYWDDWPFAWTAHFLGPERLIDSFLRVRPFLGPIFWLTTTLLPETPLAWQTFALVVRFLLTLSAWWTFRQIWPNYPWQTLLASLAFLVYPGYSQHWVAFTHINQELLPLLFYILSFGMTGLALRSRTGILRRTTLSLLLLVLGVFPTEYFLTLEPLRFLFILSIVQEQSQNAHPFSIPNQTPSQKTRDFLTVLLRALRAWLPYLLVWGWNALWLFLYYRSGLYANYDIVLGETPDSPTSILWDLVSNSADALWKAGLYAWALLPILAAQTFNAPSTWLALGVMAACFGLLWLTLRCLSLAQPFSASWQWALQAIIIGAIGLILGRIPSWAAGLPLTLQSSFDRFTVSMFISAALLMAGLITLWFQHEQSWKFVVALLIALGVGQQFYSANIFRRDWERQQSLYWQLVWRIPALTPGTVLLTDEVEIDYETDYSLTAAINWMYAPQFNGTQLPYLVLGVAERPGRLPALEPGHSFEFAYRPVNFYGNTAQAVVFIFPPGGCLRILDPAFDTEATLGKQSTVLSQLLPLSNPGLIKTGASLPALPPEIFGAQPAPTWCYYYTKAEQARQQQNWEKITRLWKEAQEQGLRPSNPLETLPFLEASARSGDWAQVEQLSQITLQTPAARKALCALWKRLSLEISLPAELLSQSGCTP